MSAGIRVRVRTPGGEVEIEVGDPASVDAAMDVASRIMRELASKPQGGAPPEARAPGEAQGVEEPQQGAERIEIPDLKVEKGDSLADVILKMFETSWGRKPRRLSEIMEALSSYGLIYPKSSVAVALLRLAKGGEIRRFKEGGEYVYIRREPLAGGEARCPS
ncbi:MAG: hypothetical protein RXP27_04400 [Nitrososphaeria archaeon]|jgi:hypothetical protein